MGQVINVFLPWEENGDLFSTKDISGNTTIFRDYWTVKGNSQGQGSYKYCS